MKNVKFLKVLSCVSAVALAGCGNSALLRDDVSVWGTNPLIENDSFQEIDLAILLDPSSEGIVGADSAEDSLSNLEQAFDAFNLKIDAEPDVAKQKQLRNRVQERILAASNERCGEYKQLIKEMDAEVNFWLGSATTAVAGVGAILTGVNTVRAFSGTASILSGVRSEFNEDFFANKTIQVITDGLESKRRGIYENILKDREADLTDYPVERAIKDAISYHESCSLIAGLEQAAKSIERADNPGVDAMNKFLEKSGDTRSLLDVMTGKPQIGVAAANKDMPQLYVSLDDSQQTRSAVQSDKDKRLQIPADLKADTVAKTARENWKAVADAPFPDFDKADTEILEMTVKIAAKVHKLTEEIKAKKTTKDQRSVKIAKLAVEQANIRVQANELNRAEQTLANSVEKALKGFENAMTKVKAKIEAKTAVLKEAQAGGNADAIAKAQADFDAKSKAAEAAAKAN